jgi:hypothetical protein
VVFEWSAADRPLRGNEQYVLAITHQSGRGYVWTEGTRVEAGERDLEFLSTHGPEIRWQVAVAEKRTGDPGEDPSGSMVSPYSSEGMFYWYSGGTEPTKAVATPTRVQPTPTR